MRAWHALAAGAAMLAAAAAVLLAGSFDTLRRRHEADADDAARRVSLAVALRIGHALDAGVPLARMNGIEALLERERQQAAGLSALCVRVSGKELAAVPHPCSDAAPTQRAAVTHRGRRVAEVIVQREPAALPAIGARLPLALLLAACGVLLAAREAALQAAARGPMRRRRMLEQLAQALAEGRLDAIQPPAPTWLADLHLPVLRASLRELHEERGRLQRLLGTLRAAEPDPARRDGYDQLRRTIDGDDRFADGALAVRPVPAVPGPSLARSVLAVAALVLAWIVVGS